MSFSVITPTRDRHCTFELCVRWMERSTIRPEWIVVDDGDEPVEPPSWATHVRLDPSSTPHTNARNVRVGMEAASGEKVMYVEDDDWFPANYLEWMEDGDEDVAACSGIKVYHVGQRKYVEKPVKGWGPVEAPGGLSSFRLRGDAAKKAMVDATNVAIAHGLHTLDNVFWEVALGRGLNCQRRFRPDAMVFLKGFPGKWRLSKKHRSMHGFDDDKKRSVLRSWVGDEDADTILKQWDLATR